MKKIYCLLIFVSLFFMSCVKSGGTKVMYQYPNDKGLWNHTFEMAKPFVVPEKMPGAIIIPHHDICMRQQNSFYSALSKFGSPSVIVVIGPDHFEKGTSRIVVPRDTTFFTPDGELELDKNLITKLENCSELSGSLSFQSEPWEMEHGVFIHTPFIHHYFPDSVFVPLLLKPCSDGEDFVYYKKLAQFLNENLPDDALVIGSVDFSHYQIPKMTELHDHVSLNTLANFESPRTIEVDSPESVYTVMEYSRMRGNTKTVLLHRTSTFDFIPDPLVESTSHQYWTFYSSEDSALIENYFERVQDTQQRWSNIDYSSTKNQTVIIGGSGNIGAGIRTEWFWDRWNESTDRGELLLKDLAGKEARFLSGFDAYIFDPPEGQRFVQKKHGTTLAINSSWVSNYEELLEVQELPQPSIRIAVISGLGAFADRSVFENACEKLLDLYDLVVARDDDGMVDGYVAFKTDDGIQEINLGTIVSDCLDQVSGAVVVADWISGELHLDSFEYESESNVVPAINQFLPDE